MVSSRFRSCEFQAHTCPTSLTAAAGMRVLPMNDVRHPKAAACAVVRLSSTGRGRGDSRASSLEREHLEAV